MLHAQATRRTCPDPAVASTSLRDELVESAPYLLTALDPLGNTVYQSPMSCRQVHACLALWISLYAPSHASLLTCTMQVLWRCVTVAGTSR